jgi:Signal transduction histidine kinase
VNHRVENAIEIQIFRILQELLTNIIKHAKASEVIIQFSEIDDSFNIMIEDNGIGFNASEEFTGMGLKNIKDRMEHISGELMIDSSIENGTTIILKIPL